MDAETSDSHTPGPPSRPDQIGALEVRLTYRTMRVIAAIRDHPGASNREVGRAAGIDNEGQTSKLLARLERIGLIANSGEGRGKRIPNAWTLTAKGIELNEVIAGRLGTGGAS